MPKKSKNSSKRRSYDDEGNERLGKRARKLMEARRVSKGARRLYLFGVPVLEREQGGLCAPVTAGVRDFARAVCCDKGGITKWLRELSSEGLIEYKPGQDCLGGEATQVRRRSYDEFTTGVWQDVLRSIVPAPAYEVAAVLNGRTIAYDHEVVRPEFTPSFTGKITHKRPFIGGRPAEERWAGLLAGVQPGAWLIEADIKAAEPTVIRQLLAKRGFFTESWPNDPYQALATLMGLSRDEAKKSLNTMFYHPGKPTAWANQLAKQGDHFFRRLAKAAEQFRNDLKVRGKPVRGKVRNHVRTQSGQLIEAIGKPNERPHPGQFIKWLADATVAEIVNSCLAGLFAMEEDGGLQVLLPVGDAIYIEAEEDCSEWLEKFVEKKAADFGFDLTVTTHTERKAGGSEVRESMAPENDETVPVSSIPV